MNPYTTKGTLRRKLKRKCKHTVPKVTIKEEVVVKEEPRDAAELVQLPPSPTPIDVNKTIKSESESDDELCTSCDLDCAKKEIKSEDEGECSKKSYCSSTPDDGPSRGKGDDRYGEHRRQSKPNKENSEGRRGRTSKAKKDNQSKGAMPGNVPDWMDTSQNSAEISTVPSHATGPRIQEIFASKIACKLGFVKIFTTTTKVAKEHLDFLKTLNDTVVKAERNEAFTGIEDLGARIQNLNTVKKANTAESNEIIQSTLIPALDEFVKQHKKAISNLQNDVQKVKAIQCPTTTNFVESLKKALAGQGEESKEQKANEAISDDKKSADKKPSEGKSKEEKPSEQGSNEADKSKPESGKTNVDEKSGDKAGQEMSSDKKSISNEKTDEKKSEDGKTGSEKSSEKKLAKSNEQKSDEKKLDDEETSEGKPNGEKSSAEKLIEKTKAKTFAKDDKSAEVESDEKSKDVDTSEEMSTDKNQGK
ncbi:cylicin-1-like, partial [Contarinia nasturtii]|uniref:cylicin-1-like n=1 Tax=Contarinia nasturtii TaxID=265458 RepID=UPI0012D41456